MTSKKSGAFDGCQCHFKKPHKESEIETRELLGGTEEKSVSLMIRPPGKSMIFYLSGPPNI